MDVVIPRNTKLPVIVRKTRVTKVDNQPTMKLRIFEGERALTADNHLLGSFEIRNIPPAPRGKGKVKTCIEVNWNGILRVTGVEDITGATGKLTIRNTEGRLSQEEIDRMIEDARKRRTIDGSFRMRSKAMNKLENFSYEIKSKIEEGNVGDQVSQHQLDYMLNKLDKTLEWLRKNRKEVVLLSEIQKREDQLKLVCNPIIDEGSSSTRL